MIYAHNELGEKIEAVTGASGWCPLCTSKLIAKCGDINIHHWAHVVDESSIQCIHEKETAWHVGWKNYFPRECQEVVITHPSGARKIADVRDNGLVIEFQHSPISTQEITARESHYGNMVWVFDLCDAFEGDRLQLNTKHDTIWWRQYKPSLFACKKDFYFDIGDGRILRPHNVRLKDGWMAADVNIIPVKDFVWEFSSKPYFEYVKHFPV